MLITFSTSVRHVPYCDMASTSHILCLVLDVAFFVLSSAEFVKLECKQVIGIRSQSSVVECVVKAVEASDVTIAGVFWTKSESPVLTYFRGQTTSSDPRLRFAETPWNTKNMNVSLLVTNTQLADDGQYRCHVITDSGEAIQETSLKVTARYSKPVMSSIPDNDIQERKSVAIFCESMGGYPAGRIQWYDQYGNILTLKAKTEVLETKDKSFNLRSKLTVEQASRSCANYTCRVFNSKADQEGETQYQLLFAAAPSKQEGSVSNVAVTAVFVVVGSLACGVLILLLLRKKRHENVHLKRRDSTLYNMPEQQPTKQFLSPVS